ncbi:MAG: methyltransferase domain-containing protein, partial [Oscillospiraceae bacterium]|nr:methyltransferase domain-containing protein [Oscillospiraceae bacterium]
GARLYDGAAARAPGFDSGRWLVADPGAYAAAFALASALPRGEAQIWDACAAPGGKAFLTAMLMGGRARVLASDVSAKKLETIRAGARRLGLEGLLEVRQADASAFQPDRLFDAVLCDVPCSGLGSLANKPDIRYKKPESFARLPRVQRAILDNAARAVKPGGVLVYATCTFRRAENEEVTAGFLADHPAFAREGFDLPFHGSPEALRAGGGEMTLWPHVHGTDGFYLCRMRRMS